MADVEGKHQIQLAARQRAVAQAEVFNTRYVGHDGCNLFFWWLTNIGRASKMSKGVTIVHNLER
jgi:hypothetical protein